MSHSAKIFMAFRGLRNSDFQFLLEGSSFMMILVYINYKYDVLDSVHNWGVEWSVKKL